MDMPKNKALQNNSYTAKNIVLVIGIVIVISVGTYAVWWKKQAAQNLSRIQAFENALQASSNTQTIEIPTTDPVGLALPEIDPLQSTNPFENTKTNPFE